jgi:hypothetical protein
MSKTANIKFARSRAYDTDVRHGVHHGIVVRKFSVLQDNL